MKRKHTHKPLTDYRPYEGFYDLREYDIPKKEFRGLWKVQDFLYAQNKKRKYLQEFCPAEWQQLQEASAIYQQQLFEYKKHSGGLKPPCVIKQKGKSNLIITSI